MDREDHLKYGGHAAGSGCSETYKLKGFGETPGTLTAEMFVPKASV